MKLESYTDFIGIVFINNKFNKTKSFIFLICSCVNSLVPNLQVADLMVIYLRIPNRYYVWIRTELR